MEQIVVAAARTWDIAAAIPQLVVQINTWLFSSSVEEHFTNLEIWMTAKAHLVGLAFLTLVAIAYCTNDLGADAWPFPTSIRELCVGAVSLICGTLLVILPAFNFMSKANSWYEPPSMNPPQVQTDARATGEDDRAVRPTNSEHTHQSRPILISRAQDRTYDTQQPTFPSPFSKLLAATPPVKKPSTPIRHEDSPSGGRSFRPGFQEKLISLTPAPPPTDNTRLLIDEKRELGKSNAFDADDESELEWTPTYGLKKKNIF